ncbi:MAG: CDP-glucose 4,6-dehydratase [Peptostreptococcaceae bacterium]
MKNMFWKNKTVLVTGHTGFKGSWLCIYLLELGAKVIGYSLDYENEKDNYNLSNLNNRIIDIKGDIRDFNKLSSVFVKYNPDIVFHLAAQPLVIKSYKKPYETYETNVMGTLNVLEGIRKISKKSVGIIITTDKCYENKEQLWGYREDDTLGGYDLYSSSKACCEILVKSYRDSFFNKHKYNEHEKSISTARAGNVIGGGDWSKYRLIPDMIKAFEKNERVIIRSPKSIRPWQHVIDPISGYLLLAEKTYENPLKFTGAYNFGPDINEIITVESLGNKISKYLGVNDLIKIEEDDFFHETNLLFLDNSKAKIELGWRPVLNTNESISFTLEWYKNYKFEDVYEICKNQIQDYLIIKEKCLKN